MTRLQDDSDEYLPELADILSLKHKSPTKGQHSTSDERPTKALTNSKVVQASLRLQTSEPRRQRPLKKISNNAVSLPPLFAPPRAAEDQLNFSNLKPELESVRRTPSRRAKTNTKVIAVPHSVDSSSEDGDSGSAFEDLSTASEGENDSVIGIISWRKPKGSQLRSPFHEKIKTLQPSPPKANFEVLEDGSPLIASPRPPSLPFPTLQRIEQPSNSSRPSSSEADKAAILTYEPPKRRSPVKLPPSSRPRTPSPPPSPSKSKLVSPSKSRVNIPPTPHRPSIDAFWAPDVINTWNEQYSPQKTLTSPRKNRFTSYESSDSETTPTNSPRKQSPSKSRSPSKSDRAANTASKRAFEARKHALATSFLAELDDKITSGRIAAATASTGGVKIVWSNKLNTTAGRAHWRREKIRSVDGSGPAQHTLRHHCSIDLAAKVISDDNRLRNVLAHEFCHLATFVIDGVRDRPHGREFRAWGARVAAAFGDSGVVVTTKHGFDIEYRFVWECVNCGLEFKRHSKSVDTERCRCGACKGRLVQTKPVPRAAPLNGFQCFMKDNFARVRKENPGAAHGAVMEILGKMYREDKKSDSSEKVELIPSKDEGFEREKGDAFDALAKELEIITLED